MCKNNYFQSKISLLHIPSNPTFHVFHRCHRYDYTTCNKHYQERGQEQEHVGYPSDKIQHITVAIVTK